MKKLLFFWTNGKGARVLFRNRVNSGSSKIYGSYSLGKVGVGLMALLLASLLGVTPVPGHMAYADGGVTLVVTLCLVVPTVGVGIWWWLRRAPASPEPSPPPARPLQGPPKATELPSWDETLLGRPFRLAIGWVAQHPREVAALLLLALLVFGFLSPGSPSSPPPPPPSPVSASPPPSPPSQSPSPPPTPRGGGGDGEGTDTGEGGGTSGDTPDRGRTSVGADQYLDQRQTLWVTPMATAVVLAYTLVFGLATGQLALRPASPVTSIFNPPPKVVSPKETFAPVASAIAGEKLVSKSILKTQEGYFILVGPNEVLFYQQQLRVDWRNLLLQEADLTMEDFDKALAAEEDVRQSARIVFENPTNPEDTLERLHRRFVSAPPPDFPLHQTTVLPFNWVERLTLLRHGHPSMYRLQVHSMLMEHWRNPATGQLEEQSLLDRLDAIGGGRGSSFGDPLPRLLQGMMLQLEQQLDRLQQQPEARDNPAAVRSLALQHLQYQLLTADGELTPEQLPETMQLPSHLYIFSSGPTLTGETQGNIMSSTLEYLQRFAYPTVSPPLPHSVWSQPERSGELIREGMGRFVRMAEAAGFSREMITALLVDPRLGTLFLTLVAEDVFLRTINGAEPLPGAEKGSGPGS